MRSSVAVFMFILIYSVYSKSNTKALTESMGQEVIEIGNPLKDLPPDLEEEPSAEVDDDDDDKPSSTTAGSQGTTTARKETKTSRASETPSKSSQPQTTIADGIRRKGKDPSDNSQEEEEAKIEKELAEIYKDTEDYKADSSENSGSVGNGNNSEEKSALRARTNFKFQPDRINQREVEKFRTSVDEISCDRSVTKKMSLATGGANMVPVFNTALVSLCTLVHIYQ